MIPLPLRFAFRYLFARKSYNVINLISGIGVAGMAVGTAALITVLSVFNGFNALVSDSLAQAGATLVVRPAGGKVFIPEGPAFDWLSQHASSVSQVLEEQAAEAAKKKREAAKAGAEEDADLEEAPHVAEHEETFAERRARLKREKEEREAAAAEAADESDGKPAPETGAAASDDDSDLDSDADADADSDADVPAPEPAKPDTSAAALYSLTPRKEEGDE